MGHLILETINSIKNQDYTNIEIVVYDDYSTDATQYIDWTSLGVRYIKGKENVGVGKAFQAAIDSCKGEIIILMCADDLITTRQYVNDVVDAFKRPGIGHVSRWYHQFVGNDRHPVRAWRGKDAIVLANNPSGLAFRKTALQGCSTSNKMFIETTQLTSQVIANGWGYSILPYDAIAVRVHDSTSTKPGYWIKRRVSSPVVDWVNLGGKEILKDHVSLIQIKNGLTNKEVFEEITNFVRLRPLNLLVPGFWFFGIIALATPREILIKLPKFYRRWIGRYITKAIRREDVFVGSTEKI
jgi:glycosyltransferase involved in cell wall biosynthesis